jgi:hypothetical protein
VSNQEIPLGIYLVADISGRSFVRRAINALLIKASLHQIVSSIRKNLKYTDPIFVITTHRYMLKGLSNVEQILPSYDPNANTQSRWASRSLKWELGYSLLKYPYFLYLDLYIFVFSPHFIQEYLNSGKSLGLMLSTNRSGYSHSLLPLEYQSQDMFDTCVIAGKSDQLQSLFSESKRVYQQNREIFDRYGDMAIINRAIVNLSLSRETIHQISGIPYAHLTNDYSQSLYHFNSGNLLTKFFRMCCFIFRYRFSRITIKDQPCRP